MTVKDKVAEYVGWYGTGANGQAPTEAQWTRLLNRDPEAPLVLTNFFKFREVALYASGGGSEDVSGQEAFGRYASVSIPAMERAGGSFLLVAPFAGAFLGEDEDWDLMAIGSYPNLAAFHALYGAEDYRAAFHHRTAATLRQKVLICEAGA